MNKIYTRGEIAQLLNMPADNLSNIQRELKKRGYEYNTSGRGDTYLIEITKEPTQDIKWFSKTYFGITPRNLQDFIHFLQFIFLSPIGEKRASWSPGCIAKRTNYSINKIKDFMNKLQLSGAIIWIPEFNFYYATKTRFDKPDVETQDYNTYQEVREINISEYKTAYEAFQEEYQNCMKNIKNNPNMVPELAIVRANGAKAGALEGWWPCAKPRNLLLPNKYWDHMPQLISLLEEYEFDDYYVPTVRNVIEDERMRELNDMALEALLDEKRAKIDKNKKDKVSRALGAIPEDIKNGSTDEYMKYLYDIKFYDLFKKMEEE